MSTRKIEIKKLDFFVYLFLTIFFIWNISTFDYSTANIGVVFTFLLLGAFFYIKIITAKKNITLYRVFYIFCFIFMFYAPLQQYLNGTVFQLNNGWSLVYNDRDYIQANIVISVFVILFDTGYKLASLRKINKKKKRNYIVKPSDFSSIVLLLISIFAVLVLCFSGNLTGREGYDVSNQNISQQINNILRFMPVSCFFISFLQLKKHYSNSLFWIHIIYLIEAIIVYFPFNGAVSRFLLFGVYLSVVSLFCSKSKYKSIFFLLYVIGFFFVFSAFNYFKTHTITDLSGFSLFKADFCSIDFDAYQMLMATINYVEAEGIVFGKNILTACLCFIPRSIWTGKMVPSGQIVAEYWGTWFTNVSCPIMAECFIAFGYIGVFCGGFLVGGVFEIIDDFDYSKGYFKKTIFYLLSGLLVYILRGALLPVVSYTVALIIALLLVYVINKYFSKFYIKRKAFNFIEPVYGN